MSLISRQFTAHYRRDDHKPQSVKDHLLKVRQLAEHYAKALKVSHIAGLAGMLHDVGKYTDAFQNYLYMVVFYPEEAPRRGSVDHASAGGKLLFEILHNANHKDVYSIILAEIVGNVIISHHSYLYDFLDPDLGSPYLKRVTKKEEDLPGYAKAVKIFYREIMSYDDLHNYIQAAVHELKLYIKNNPGNIMEKLTLLIRFIFSCLIDADRTNTREFEENNPISLPVERKILFQRYYRSLLNYLNKLNADQTSFSTINVLREKMSLQCDQFAENVPGTYTLSIPTGGGKTLASLRYALKHAQKYNKKQIIYVVPYTTIIEQNAQVIRQVLKDDEHILEHHSNLVIEDEQDSEMDEGKLSVREKLELAKDNWDCPIILTTMVQFLDTFYKRSSRDIRRLHHLTQAVIIFDEVQKVPIHCITLFNQSLNFLKTFGQSTILLCTATQPALDFVKHRLEVSSDGEIVGNLGHVSEAFRRVEIIDKSYHKTFNNEQLADFINQCLQKINSMLVILNTRTVVRNLYRILKDRVQPINLFHLSTSMCAAHRDKILSEIKECLKNGDKVICISTQLIEAGVDVSFECVIRSLAGLDSIAQAAGRCNRNGEYDGLRKVYIIDHSEEKLASPALKAIREGKSVTKKLLADLHRDPSKYEGNILSKSAMDWYFKNYFSLMRDELDFNVKQPQSTMVHLLYDDQNTGYAKAYSESYHHRLPLCLVSSLRTAADKFYVIKNATTSVIVPYGKGKEIIAQLSSERSIEDLGNILKRAQHYSVNMYEQEKIRLSQAKQLSFYLEGQIIVLNEASYSDEYGLDVEGESKHDPYVY
ncbi:CRISPR-associated helicase Cas3' [Sporolactobacillus sp. Y61]|uniref:CRISPR-associated helicase Cas3 n=1 Tax=Sporolactobacillus sp. Y61 TaxID=3160863 RepID=A0AAU8IJX8_9BACL